MVDVSGIEPLEPMLDNGFTVRPGAVPEYTSKTIEDGGRYSTTGRMDCDSSGFGAPPPCLVPCFTLLGAKNTALPSPSFQRAGLITGLLLQWVFLG